MYIGFHVKDPSFLSDLIKLELSREIFVKYLYIKFLPSVNLPNVMFQLTTVSIQLTTVSIQLTTVSIQLTTISIQLTTISIQLTTVSIQLLTCKRKKQMLPADMLSRFTACSST